MANIVSPAVLDFVTRYARPLATEIEALYFKIGIANREWNVPGVSSACTNADDVIADGNNKSVTAGQLSSFLIDLNAMIAEMDLYGQEKIGRAASLAGHLSMFDEANRAG